MFDIGFSEMLVVGIVALVVIGPERLPKVARTLGHLFGRLQRYVAQVKTDINREMEMAELGKVKTEFESAARSFQNEVEGGARDAEREMREMQESIDRDIGADPASARAAASAAGTPPATAAPQLELGLAPPQPPAKPEPRP